MSENTTSALATVALPATRAVRAATRRNLTIGAPAVIICQSSIWPFHIKDTYIFVPDKGWLSNPRARSASADRPHPRLEPFAKAGEGKNRPLPCALIGPSPTRSWLAARLSGSVYSFGRLPTSFRQSNGSTSRVTRANVSTGENCGRHRGLRTGRSYNPADATVPRSVCKEVPRAIRRGDQL